MIFVKKLKASSLLSTLILSLILFITCSLLLLGIYYFRYFQVKDQINDRLESNIQSVTTIALSKDFSELPARDSFLLFNGAQDSGYYTKELWGVFPVTSVKTSFKGRYKYSVFLSGASHFQYEDATLYLADHDRPLSLAGDTYIEGTAYLPKSGIRSGFFQQKGFSRKKLIEGITESSNKQLPALASYQISYFKALYKYFSDKNDALTLIEDDFNSFSGAVKTVKANSWGNLANRSLAGKIIVISDSVIEVDGSCKLHDVLLLAPFIHFKEGFEGAVQAFALDSITVDDGCKLTYPSALVGIGRQEALGNTGATVTLHSGSSLEGILLAIKGDEKSNIQPAVKIKEGASVTGMVYCDGYTYLNGKIAGSIYTHFFFEQRGPLSMENILIDVTVTNSNRFKLGSYFSILEGASSNQVVKWLK